jgi:hypothetical protein
MEIPSSSTKHNFTGIGNASAAILIAAMSANPALLGLTTGIPGKILFKIFSKIFSTLASMGVVLLNIGAEKLLIAAEKSNFDGSIDSALKLVENIRSTGRDLTPEEIKQIDDKVIEQFRKFAKMTRGRK